MTAPVVTPGLVARFWAKVRRGPRCWEWTASLDRDGYGQIGSGPRPATMLKAHRVSWMIANGGLPDGACVLHRCDNPRCVRPDHLFLGTVQDNNADMTAKGRNVFQKRNPSRKLSDGDVVAIRERRRAGEILRTIASDYGVAEGTVSRIASGIQRGAAA